MISKTTSDDFLVEYPTHSGNKITLNHIADEISHRMINIFLRDTNGRRAVFGVNETFQNDPNWRDYIPFHEYFHGDNGAGVRPRPYFQVFSLFS